MKTQQTTQEIFDIVAAHLLQQKARCVDRNGNCMYRGPKGLKCAAGCLIPDEEYTERFENRAVSAPDTQVGIWFRNRYTENQIMLITDLQRLHDNFSGGSWEDSLQILAIKHNLTFTPPPNDNKNP